MKKQSNFGLFFFLALFGLSVGIFNNYAEMWLATNGLEASSISNVFSISYIVTVLMFLYFTIRFSKSQLRRGVLISLLMILGVNVTLIFLNGTGQLVAIKFLMFFNLALTDLILSSIYPLMMSIDKSDEAYTKKSVVESLFNNLGFFMASMLIGKTIIGFVFDYNVCLIISTAFATISFILLFFIKVSDEKKESVSFDLNKAISYFNSNKILYFYLFLNMLGSVVWCSILGMPMLTLIEKLHFNSNIASFTIFGLGIISNFLAMIVLKYLRFKNDHINLFFKFGIRIILFVLSFLTNNELVFVLTIIYLLLTDCVYNFIFSSFFSNNIDENYIVLFTALKYSSSLIGYSLGTLICGLVFEWSIRFMILPTVILSIVHYILASILVSRKKSFNYGCL